MSNEEKPEETKQLQKFTAAEPVEATITFEIPAYKDKNTGETFKRVLKMPTKKAYAIFKKLIQKEFVK